MRDVVHQLSVKAFNVVEGIAVGPFAVGVLGLLIVVLTILVMVQPVDQIDQPPPWEYPGDVGRPNRALV
jgi:hypothetical protein